MSKTVLIQTIQFSISIQFSSIWPIDRTLSGAITLGQSGPGSDDNEKVHLIPQSSSITGISPSDCFVSYPGHSFFFGGGGLTPQQRCSRCILQPQPTGQAIYIYIYIYIYIAIYIYIYIYIYIERERERESWISLSKITTTLQSTT